MPAPSIPIDPASTDNTPSSAMHGDWRAPLLDQAMSCASILPERAHAKVKARLQRDVAAAAIDCGLPESAVRLAESIDGLPRGEVLAMAAQALARSGDRALAEACVARAVAVAAHGDEGWMRDHLNAEVGLAFAALGDPAQARRHAAVSRTELVGRVEAALVAGSTAEELDRQCDAFDAAIATGSMDVVRSGVDGHLAVWMRAPSDTTRAGRCESAVRAALQSLPVELQVPYRARLADALAAAGRNEESLAELRQAHATYDANGFTPDIWAALARDLANCDARHGLADQGLRLLRDCTRRYERDPAEIPDLERGDALRPLAEGFAALGDRQAALRLWDMALEAGALNPNGRPRARDLCLTCVSMCRANVQPTPAMQRRILALARALKAPW